MSSLDINYFEKNKTGVLVARMTSDMQSLNEFAREGASSILTSLLTIFGATIAVFLVDVQLSLLSFLILPLLGIATRIFRNHADKTYWSVREWIGQVLSSLQEGISGVRIIQAYSDETKQLKRFKEDINEVKNGYECGLIKIMVNLGMQYLIASSQKVLNGCMRALVRTGV